MTFETYINHLFSLPAEYAPESFYNQRSISFLFQTGDHLFNSREGKERGNSATAVSMNRAEVCGNQTEIKLIYYTHKSR